MSVCNLSACPPLLMGFTLVQSLPACSALLPLTWLLGLYGVRTKHLVKWRFWSCCHQKGASSPRSQWELATPSLALLAKGKPGEARNAEDSVVPSQWGRH